MPGPGAGDAGPAGGGGGAPHDPRRRRRALPHVPGALRSMGMVGPEPGPPPEEATREGRFAVLPERHGRWPELRVRHRWSCPQRGSEDGQASIRGGEPPAAGRVMSGRSGPSLAPKQSSSLGDARHTLPSRLQAHGGRHRPGAWNVYSTARSWRRTKRSQWWVSAVTGIASGSAGPPCAAGANSPRRSSPTKKAAFPARMRTVRPKNSASAR